MIENAVTCCHYFFLINGDAPDNILWVLGKKVMPCLFFRRVIGWNRKRNKTDYT